MDCRKWIEKYSIDCMLKYNSEATRKNYISQVTCFLYRFVNYREPKEIPTQEIKSWLLEKESPNTRNHRLCAVKSFYEITVLMPVKLDKIPFAQMIRHNSFTHLCEAGTDINLIQRLAGHTSPKTTSIYLHISHNTISKINSPLNYIQL